MSAAPVFSVAEIEKIAELASLELTEEEKTTFARQFADILNYFKVIDAAPLPAADTASPDAAGPIFREDKAVSSGVSPEDFSAYLEDRHFKVPNVIE